VTKDPIDLRTQSQSTGAADVQAKEQRADGCIYRRYGKMRIVALSFVFDKYCSIRLKRFIMQIIINYAISYYLFYLYLMLHTCVIRFDVTENI
jgi:hypothetical protein